MKKGLALFLCLSLPVQAAFLKNTDVPLMDGLIIDENDSVSFDTPAGQIILTTANTDKTSEEIISFYQETLTALGWQQKNQTSYKRDQDEITLQLIPSPNGTTVKLQLTFTNK